MRPYIYRKCLLSYLHLHFLQISNSTPSNHKLLVSLWLFGSEKCLAGQCFSPNPALKPMQILCIVECIACLILEDLADYVMRTRKTWCRQANERWTGCDGNKLKITGKRSNRLIGGVIKQQTFRIEMKVSLKRQCVKIFYKIILIFTPF